MDGRWESRHYGKLGGERHMKFERITVDSNVCTGKPCIRGLRFPVSRLIGLLASGETRESILQAYPYLEAEDIDEALRYAAYLAEEETVEFAG
jgi:uncharacterized protein (DUF433 family)